MEKNEIDGKPAKKLKTIAKKPDQIILNPKTTEDNNSLHERVVQLAQRRKRSSLMRRVQAKLQRRKEMSSSKLHSQSQLAQKSSQIAKNILRKRFAGSQGADYQHLSPSNKVQVDKIIDKKAILIRSMAKKLIPRLRSADVKRLQAVRSGGAVHGIQSYFSNKQLNQNYEYDLDHLVGMFEQITEKDIIALELKASQHSIPEEVLEMVFLRGLYEGDKDKAFNRVNSFIALGEAAKIDADLEQDSKPSDRLDGTNSLAKVYKKETPGQNVKEEVWDQPNPKKKHSSMTPAQKAEAKARAKAAGRPYPNLVDNMAAMKEGIDDEGGMSKGELSAISRKAAELAKKMKKNKQLDGWVQSKITKADDYIGSVHDYLMHNKQEVDEQAQPIEELKSSTLTSYIDKVATGPSRGKTQSGLLKSIKAISGVTKAIRKRAENSMKEESDSCCGDCGSVEEEFTPTGLEQYEDWGESIISEEEVGGRKVQLGKPFLTPGGPKKRSVYVKNDKGNVVKVNFGDTTGLTIKTDDPERRKAFRSRHNCDNPGPRHKANYWSCKAWSKGSVSAGLGGAGGK